MVSEAFNPKISLISERSGLTPLQAKACDEALGQHVFLPYFKFFAQGHALGLSSLQWMKAYFFKNEYDFLSQKVPDQRIDDLLKGTDKFYAYDKLLGQAPTLPAIAQSYDQKTLFALAHQIIQYPDKAPEALIKESGLTDVDQASTAIQYAFAIDLIQQATLLHQLRQTLWEKGRFTLQPHTTQNEHVKALLEQWPSPAPLVKKIDALLFLKFWQAKKNKQVDVLFDYPENSNWLFDSLAEHIGWSSKNRAADQWIEQALKLTVDIYLYPRLHRDLLALCFDHAVDQLLPLVEVQWRQLLKQKAIGAKQILMFYPHGKSGVMVVHVNEQGETLQDFTIYPHAPDYQIENSVAEVAKILTRHPVEHIGWLVQPETKKAIQKLLKLVHERYPDLHWQTHWLSNRLTPLFALTNKKNPDLEEVIKAPQFLQSPWFFWKNCQPEQFLHPILRTLPKERLHYLWHTLLQETLLLEGIDVNQAPHHVFEILEILQPEDIDKILEARTQNPIVSHTQLQKILSKEPQVYANLAPFFRMGEDIHCSPFLEEDKPLIEAILATEQCSIKELLEESNKIQHAMQNQKLLQDFGYDRLFRLQNLLWHIQEHQKPKHHLTTEIKKNLSQIKPGTRFVATIHKILNYGCFVDLGEGVEGLLHISAIGDCFINDLNYIFQPGEVICIDWLQYDEEKKRLSLSLQTEKLKYKPMTQKPMAKKVPSAKTSPAEKKPSAIGPSAMALAFAKLKK